MCGWDGVGVLSYESPTAKRQIGTFKIGSFSGSCSVAGDTFSLSPETVNKLNLDSEDRVYTQGRRRLGLGVSQAFLGLGKAERSVSWALLHCFLDLPGSYSTI